MKQILFLLVAAFYFQAAAQQSVVQGIVTIHNSETQTGKRQYVTNAQLEALSIGA